MQEKNKEIPYNEAFFKTSHNSYEHSIMKQLNMGVRGLEYDIHDDKIQELDDFEVYHLQNNRDVLLDTDSNPKDYLFSNWLKILQDWSNEKNNNHAPITLFVELKDSIIDTNNEPDNLYGIKKLNEIIKNSIEHKSLFTYKKFRDNNFSWPTVKDLQGCILIVLVSYWGGYWAASEGGFQSRLKYLKNSLKGIDDICFVSWVQEDKGSEVTFLKEKSHFWKCSLEYSTKNYATNVELQRLTRVDFDKIVWGRHVKTYYNKNYEKGYRSNFPATDAWSTTKYNTCFPWSV